MQPKLADRQQNKAAHPVQPHRRNDLRWLVDWHSVGPAAGGRRRVPCSGARRRRRCRTRPGLSGTTRRDFMLSFLHRLVRVEVQVEEERPGLHLSQPWLSAQCRYTPHHLVAGPADSCCRLCDLSNRLPSGSVRNETPALGVAGGAGGDERCLFALAHLAIFLHRGCSHSGLAFASLRAPCKSNCA